MIATFLRFLLSRSSNNAACVVIEIAHCMNQTDLRNIEDYLRTIRELRGPTDGN